MVSSRFETVIFSTGLGVSVSWYCVILRLRYGEHGWVVVALFFLH